MFRTLRVFLCVMIAALAAACGPGGGGGGDPALDEAALRERLTQLLVAGVKDDVNAAAPWLALQEYEIITAGAKPRNVRDMTPAERTELTKVCFAQLQGFGRNAGLKDSAAIKSAITAGTIQVLTKLNLAEIQFQAPRADGRGGPLRYKAKFARHPDHEWRLSEFLEQFN